MTLGKRLDTYGGIGPGFDHLRIGLAVSILSWHSFGLSYGAEWVKTVPAVLLSLLALLLPMFFGLSGFLVMGSAMRTNDAGKFITFRVLRILPALLVEVILSAVVLGGLVTTLSPRQYYSNPQFFEYFGLLIGSIKYFLPGVFDTNPIKTVNGALWTVGPEIACYCFVAAMMVCGLFTRKLPMVMVSVLLVIICIITDYWETDWNAVHLPIKALVVSFVSGNVIFLYRDSIEYDFSIFMLAALVSIIAIILAQNYVDLRSFFYIAAVAIPFCSAYIGLTNFKPMPFFKRGDYSYGIYIYGFPIQQTITFYFPDWRTWWFNLALSLPLAIFFAVMSWHFIEKPVLGFRKNFIPNRSPILRRPETSPLNLRSFAVISTIAIYGLFVTNAARVFPFKAIFYSILGKQSTSNTTTLEQF